MSSVFSTFLSFHRCSILNWLHVYVFKIFSCPSACNMQPEKPHFPLNILGVAGVFGGEEAVAAMGILHVFKGWRLLGWYSSPGSYQVVKLFHRLSRSKFFNNRATPVVHADPTTLFKSDGLKGPRFRGIHLGTIIEETGHVAALFMKECAAREEIVIGGRKTEPVGVTIARLDHNPQPRMCPTHLNLYFLIFSSISIAVSIGNCVACGLYGDWYAFLSILSGILASGISCFVIGSAKFVFTHPDPAKGSPTGGGILSSGKEIVVLSGAEGAVNSVTRGRFSLSFADERQYGRIAWCPVLFNIQFVTQLLLVPNASPLGQRMFATSLAVSWIYNWWLSSSNKEKIEQDILIDRILQGPSLIKYSLGTRTTAVVFILLVLHPEDPTEFLEELLPNDTKVWKEWKQTVMHRLASNKELVFVEKDWYLDGFTQQERSLLGTLYGDAQVAYQAYISAYPREDMM